MLDVWFHGQNIYIKIEHLSNIDEIDLHKTSKYENGNLIKKKKVVKNFATFFQPCSFIYVDENFCPVHLFHDVHLLDTQG